MTNTPMNGRDGIRPADKRLVYDRTSASSDFDGPLLRARGLLAIQRIQVPLQLLDCC